MKIYRFRVILPYEEEEIIRDLEIKPGNTLHDFHLAIQNAFGFDNSQMASFYLSDDDWDKGDEVTLLDMNEVETDRRHKEKRLIMKKVKIDDFLENDNQRMIYVYDFMNVWTFYVELINILKKSEHTKFPALVYSDGKSPKEHSENLSIPYEDDEILEALDDNVSMDDDLYEEEDYNNDDDDDDIDDFKY